ncbi:MAG: hypothetical protein WCK18_18920 [Prolixibacteraceae bacterium]|jgi:hypothetical protein
MIDFTDIDKNLPNGENMGGLVQKVYFGYHADVSVFPTKPATPNTLATASVLTGDLVMKPGKRLFEMYMTDDTGEFKIDPVGEADGKSFVEHLTLFHPGLQKKILGFINAAKNENLVFVVVDSDGQMYLMGDKLRPAVFAGAPEGVGTGKNAAARKGVSLEFTYKTASAFIYEGNVPLTEASGSI